MNIYDFIAQIFAYKSIFENYLCKFLGTVYNEFQYKRDNKTINDGGYYGSDFFGLGILSCFQKKLNINETYLLIKEIDIYYEMIAKEYIEMIIGYETINTEIYNISQKYKNNKKYVQYLSKYQFYCNKKFNYLTDLSKEYLKYCSFDMHKCKKYQIEIKQKEEVELDLFA